MKSQLFPWVRLRLPGVGGCLGQRLAASENSRRCILRGGATRSTS